MLSDNLRKLRKRNGYTQESLAEKLGISRQSVAKWERGDSSPDLSNLGELAKIYNVTLDDLVNHNEHKEGVGIGPKGKHMFGTVTVEEGNVIKIPQEAMDLFHLHKGSKLLVLADEDEGFALIDKEKFTQRMTHLYKELD